MSSTNQQQAVRTRTLLRGLEEPQREAFLATRSAFGSYKQSQKAMEKIAREIVSLRLTFTKGDQPDYGGDSPKYRALVGSLYEQIIADDEERTLFKSAIRYWIRKEITRRVDEGLIDRAALGERFTAAAVPVEHADDSEEATQRQKTAETNGRHEDTKMEQILADLAPRTAIREAGNALAARVDVVGVIPTIKAVNVALEAVAAEMKDGVTGSKPLDRAVAALVDCTLEIAVRADYNVLERLAKYEVAS